LWNSHSLPRKIGSGTFKTTFCGSPPLSISKVKRSYGSKEQESKGQGSKGHGSKGQK